MDPMEKKSDVGKRNWRFSDGWFNQGEKAQPGSQADHRNLTSQLLPEIPDLIMLLLFAL